jgi:gliding motility-associated-like protein
MKKNILLLLVSSLLSLGTTQAATDVVKCYGQSITLTTNKVGNKYEWYKNGGTTPVKTSTTNEPYTESNVTANATYKCVVTTTGGSRTTNFLKSTDGTDYGDFEFDASQATSWDQYNKTFPVRDEIRNESYTARIELKKFMRDGNCDAGESTTTKDPNGIKPDWFNSISAYQNEYMLAVDGPEANAGAFEFFEVYDLRLKAGQEYEFSCYIINIDMKYTPTGTRSLPQLQFKLVKDNNVLKSGNLFTIDPDLNNWGKYKVTYTPTQNLDGVKLVISNQTLGQEGNDFAIDAVYFGAVQNSATTSETEEFNLTVYDYPKLEFTTPNPCPNEEATITTKVTAKNGGTLDTDIKYTWSGDITSNNKNSKDLTFTAPSNEGPYEYELSADGKYCDAVKEPAEFTVTNNCGTTEEATINYPAECKNEEGTITLEAQAVGEYEWDNGATSRTINVSLDADKSIVCIVTQNNGGITNTITETHIVKTIECKSTTMCNTGDSILKAQVTGDYYEWTLADGITKETIYTTNALTISPVTASAGDILTYTCEVYEYPATTSTLPSARPPMLIATESFVVTITNCKTQATDREQVREDGSITIEVPGGNRCTNCTYRWYKIDTNGNITVLQDSETPTYTYNNAKDGEIFCDVKDDQERISHTQKYIIVTYKPEPESICYDTELTKTLEGETSETDNYEWYWLKNDTEVEFPAEAITIEGNKATLNLEYFVKQTNSTEPIVVNVLQKYEVEVEVATTEGSNNEGGEENEEEGESDDTGTHRLAQIDELEIYFEQKVTDISSVNDTKKILISDNGTLEEYDDTYFKISDSYIYQDPFGSKVGDMDSHEGHLKFTDTPMNAPQAYTGDRADNKYFVEVDGGDTAGPVFSIIANGKISKGDKYILSFLATDTSGYPTESPADIQFTININNSDDIDLTPRLLIDHNGWRRYTYPFEVPLDGEEVIITLSNYNTSSGQNDFAIDEITFTLDKTTDLIPDVALPEDRSLKLRNSELRNSEFQMWRKEFSIIINQVTSESITETAGLNKEYEKEVELPNETITFIYDPNTSQVNGRTYQEYKVSTNQYGCEHHVYFTLNLVSIEPMIFFSPNNDGLNDLWLVKGIESAPDAYIMIYDRYSKLLYKCKGSEFTGWDGNYNGHGMVQDDYWYVISIPETEEQISGHFTLKR